MSPMNVRRLVYVGKAAGDDPEDTRALRCEGQVVEPDAAFELERRRSPWSESRPHVRVIVGSHPSRADLLLQGDRIYPEHVRFYFPKEEDGPTDLRVIHEDSTLVNGKPASAREWVRLEGGEEIDLGPWRWRYELVRV